MKTSRHYLCGFLSILAIGLPVVVAADKPAGKEKRLTAEPTEERGPKEIVTFLGVEASPVSRTLTSQLGLQSEMGLVVNSVAPDSPAAGVLKPDDILIKLDDQKLIDPRQLRVLVRSYREGDEITLTYLRGGKQATAKVKLAKHEVPSAAESRIRHFGPEGFDLLRAPTSAELERLLPMMDLGRELSARVFRPSPGVLHGHTMINTADSNLVFTDDHGTIEVKVSNGEKTVTVKDAKGAVLFSGPYNTEKQKEAAPPEVRARIEKLERMDGVRFKLDGELRPGNFDVVAPRGRQIHFQIPRTFERRAPAPPRSLIL